VREKLTSSQSTLLLASCRPSQSSGRPMITTSAARSEAHVPWKATPMQAGKARSALQAQ
jgi:hypothetical protein